MAVGAAIFALGVLQAVAEEPAAPAAPADPGAKTNINVWNAEGGEKDEALHLTPNKEHGREVFEVCSACHLPEGSGAKDGTFPQLAGQHRKVLIRTSGSQSCGSPECRRSRR